MTNTAPSPAASPGTITYALVTSPSNSTGQPDALRVARALQLLIDEINHTLPVMPGDTRPVAYQLTTHQRESNK